MTQCTISTTGLPDEHKDVTPGPVSKGKSKKDRSSRSGKSKKKRSASHLEDSNGEVLPDINDAMDGAPVDDDMKEPTMGEKLASLNIEEDNATKSSEKTEDSSPHTKPPSADSVHVLLKQALHVDDRALLIDCLFRQDEKIIANSVSQLNLSDVAKLLGSLVSLINSRGAVLACSLPWLRSLLLQHASAIMSHESSLLSLNSLYQLIESRVSTFNKTLQLSSSLDLLYAGTIDDESDDVTPFIYEEKESDEESESAESMETESPEVFNDFSGSDGMAE